MVNFKGGIIFIGVDNDTYLYILTFCSKLFIDHRGCTKTISPNFEPSHTPPILTPF